jgi:Cu(I)/Ag(I) efflux system membrane fusion protein
MKNTFKNIKENYLLVIVVLIIGLSLGWIFHPGGQKLPNDNVLEGHEGHDHSSEDPTTWTCSMHPQIKQSEPGQCPICAMDLIPLKTVASSDDNIHPDELVMTESAAKLADIQSIQVESGVATKTLYLQGKVQADERKIAELTARYGGRIESLFVNFTGQNVRKGEKLATIYSPDLITAQRELLESFSFKETRPALYTSARTKLKLWGISTEQIDAIEVLGEPKINFDILSPITGTVTMRHIAAGDYIKEGMPLFKVIDLTSLWVLFDAYESDIPWIKLGDHISLSMQSIPGKTFEGKVKFIDPVIDPKTRVTKVRIELANAGLNIKPEMFVNGELHSEIGNGSDQLMIPKSSILWTGKRAVVYVKVPERENPSFLYREIVLGPSAGDYYIVSKGLEEGEIIAVNGVFKIDAAAQLEGKPSMMNPNGGRVSTGHNHGEVEQAKTSENHEGHQEAEAIISPIEVTPEFTEHLTKVYDAYLEMKDAFVKSEPDRVKNEASKVLANLESVDMGLLEGDAHIIWMGQLESINNRLKTIQSESDIEKQRTEFAAFNLTFYKSLKSFGLSEKTTYYQFCPMALDNNGAFWFSSTEEIFNPYFGDAMLSCGETKETLQKN